MIYLIVGAILFFAIGFPWNLILLGAIIFVYILYKDDNTEAINSINEDYRRQKRHMPFCEKQKLEAKRRAEVQKYVAEHPVKQSPLKTKIQDIFFIALLIFIVAEFIFLIYVLNSF